MAENEKLPPTIGTLRKPLYRTHIQARTWGQARSAQQTIPDPIGHGYYKDLEGHILPETSDSAPAPEAIIEMVRCQCNTSCTSQRCSCHQRSLPCTYLCLCTADCENDEDTFLENSTQSDNDSDFEM